MKPSVHAGFVISRPSPLHQSMCDSIAHELAFEVPANRAGLKQ
jgi:hypothetical protein